MAPTDKARAFRPAASAAAELPRAPRAGPPRIERVLVVDDDADIRDLSAAALRTVAGWEVHVADSGSEGLAKAASLAPDLVLLDHMMPDMDGAATLRALRARPETASIPVVLVTTRLRAEAREAFVALGAAGIVQKPFDPVALPGELERLLAAVPAPGRAAPRPRRPPPPRSSGGGSSC